MQLCTLCSKATMEGSACPCEALPRPTSPMTTSPIAVSADGCPAPAALDARPLSGTAFSALTNELMELVVCFALRLLPGQFSLPSDPALARLLNVVSRSVMPTPTKVALMYLPTVTLDRASESAGDVAQLLTTMVNLSTKPYGRPLSYSAGFAHVAAENGILAVLKWWQDNKDSVPLFCEADDIIGCALRLDQVHVLDWCVSQGMSLPTQHLSSIWASGSVAVLDWCRANGLALDYNEIPMDEASRNGEVYLLDWWKSSGLPLKYSHHALEYAIQENQVPVLDWWSQSGLRLYGDDLELTSLAMAHADLSLLEWLADHNFLLVHSSLLGNVFEISDLALIEWCVQRLKQPPFALGLVVEVWQAASKHASTEVLELARSLGFQLPTAKSISDCLVRAAQLGRVDNLNWLLRHVADLGPHHFQAAVDAAAMAGQVSVLEWFKQQDPACLPDRKKLVDIAKAGHLHVLEWCNKQPGPLGRSLGFPNLPSNVFLAAVENGHIDIVKWLCETPDLVPSPGFMEESRPELIVAAARGYAQVLKTWVDADLNRHYSEFDDLPLSVNKDVTRQLLRSTSTGTLKWWLTLFGCRSHLLRQEIMLEASKANKVEVLDWMLESQLLDPKREYPGLAAASRLGHVETLDWWASNAEEVKAAFDPLLCFDDNLWENGLHKACHWWVHNTSSLSLNHCELPVALLHVDGSVGLMDRMLRSGFFSLLMTHSVYDKASEGGRVDVLMWWYATDLVSNKAKRYSKEALRQASARSHITVLEWWKFMSKSVDGPSSRRSSSGGLKLRLPFRNVSAMVNHGFGSSVVDWWIKSGLLKEGPLAVDDNQGDDLDQDDEGNSDEDSGGEEEDDDDE